MVPQGTQTDETRTADKPSAVTQRVIQRTAETPTATAAQPVMTGTSIDLPYRQPPARIARTRRINLINLTSGEIY